MQRRGGMCRDSRREDGDHGTGEDDGRVRRHPPGLRGREIGLFYARQSRNRRQMRQQKIHQSVTIPADCELELSHALAEVRSERPGIAGAFDKSSFNVLEHFSTGGGRAARYASRPCDSKLDQQLLDSFHENQRLPRVQQMLQFRKRLPTYKMREEIVELVETSRVVVISGETGSGKTTQIPQFILDHYICNKKGSSCKVICTQPRRISAISVAERVAAERGERCGDGSSAGYHIRLECKVPRDSGSILFCTTGILLQQLQSDPFISAASHIILDEVHERDLQTDFLLVILKELLCARPDLRIILMSATINAHLFSEYFGGCPMLKIPGVAFPVEVFHLEDVIEVTGYRGNDTRRRKQSHIEVDGAFLRNLQGRYSSRTVDVLKEWNEDDLDLELASVLVRHICNTKPDGAILVFLPGWEAISELNKMLAGLRALVIPLHSMMPTVNQREVFDRPPPGVRKIVLATNIAETSITIDDVVYVIDCGKMKMSNFDVEKNLATLQPEWVAAANARQRKGRAGRVQPGTCYRLYTSWREMQLEAYQAPEMLRTRLENLILKIKILKLGNAQQFLEKAMNPPSHDAVRLSVEFLESLKALDEMEMLTPLGYHLARLPLEPQTGKMIILACIFSCLDPILTVAASLSFKDAFVIPLGKEKIVDMTKLRFAGDTRSDHLMLVNVFHEWEKAKQVGKEGYFCYENFLSRSTLHMLANMRKQFVDYLRDLNFINTSNAKDPRFNRNSDSSKVVTAVICAGLYPNVARGSFTKNQRLKTLCTKTEKSVVLHPKSVNCMQSGFWSEWFVYYTKIKSTRVFLHDVTPVSALPLLLFGGLLKLDGSLVLLDGWISMACQPELGILIKEVRRELDGILEKKINRNGDDQLSGAQMRLLDVIVHILSRETSSIPDMFPSNKEQL
ncbi:ATP-dependent DNA/RNA helicase DHX36-like isoform X2 [Ornithodoros turicata]